jgi:hypothetical protein
LTVLANIFFVLFYLPAGFPPSDLAMYVAIVVIIGFAILFTFTNVAGLLKKSYEVRPLLALIVAGILLFIYYTFFFSAPHFIGRYLHPLRIAVIIATSMLAPRIWQYWKQKQWTSPIKYVMIVYMLFGVGYNIMHYVYNFTIKDVNPLYWSGLWAEGHPTEKIGMTSSGIAGFMSDNVVNLDGKVNFDAMKARHADSLEAYIVHSGITVLSSSDNDLISNLEKKFGTEFTPIDTAHEIIYYRLKSK